LKLQNGNLTNKKSIVQFPTVSYRFMIPLIDFLHRTDLINDNKHTMISSAQRMRQKRTHGANRCSACSFPSLSSLFVPHFSLRLMITNLPILTTLVVIISLEVMLTFAQSKFASTSRSARLSFRRPLLTTLGFAAIPEVLAA
ncbi:unnamed protein product, partial [Ixodes pacificus]